MIKDRVQIDGVWYRREPEQHQAEIRVTFAQTCSYETGDYCWEAVRIGKGEDPALGYYLGIDIKFTDKTEKPWTEEHWDSEAWFRGVMTGEALACESAEEIMSPAGLADFKAFLRKLVELGWWTGE